MYEYDVNKWIEIMAENIASLQDRVDDLNCQKHKEVKNINDIKALSEAQKNYAVILEVLERIKTLKTGFEVTNGKL